MTSSSNSIEPVRKSIVVRASADRAFDVFTAQMDTWWPRAHHIGKTPMKNITVEGRVGGRCYTDHEDGTSCDWGRVLVWDRPKRFVFAWQVGPTWQYEPDITKSTEVEVNFISEAGGGTRVELEHRYFERLGEAAMAVRNRYDSKDAWAATLEQFAEKAQ